MGFIGSSEAKLDAKGRVFLPANFRKGLGDGVGESLVIRRDIYEQCLVIYPLAVWNEQLSQVRRRLSRWDRHQQMLYRQLLSGVYDMPLDGSGRILLPKALQEAVGIRSAVRFIGMDKTIEVWDPAVADSVMNDADFGRVFEAFMQGMDDDGCTDGQR